MLYPDIRRASPSRCALSMLAIRSSIWERKPPSSRRFSASTCAPSADFFAALLLELLELLDFEDFDDTFFVGVFFVVFFLVDVFLLVSVSFGSAGGVAI